MTSLLIDLIAQECADADLVLASPPDAARRGSHVIFANPNGYAIVQALKARGVIGDFRAICDRPAQAAIAEFKEALARYGKAKLKLKAHVVENGNVAVDVTAAFVVTR